MPALMSRCAVCTLAVGASLLLFSGVIRAAEPAEFFRGLNLNGPSLVIDGHKWEGKDAPHFQSNGRAFENTTVVLKPPTDRQRAQMIRSSRWGRDLTLDISNVPAGVYQVFAYVWEDNQSTQFEIRLNGEVVVAEHHSGGPGEWQKLGPWKVTIADGSIRLSARGGDANFSGLEIWSGEGPIPELAATAFVDEPTSDQLTFFENRIRPLLSQHCYECHSVDSKKIGGGLLLDSRAGVRKGGDSEPPIVPGDPDSSLLLVAVRHADSSLKMPPEKKLTDQEIADLETWVRQGAPDPRTEDTVAQATSKYAIDWTKARDFWSFRPLAVADPPTIAATNWSANEIDRFLLARLEERRIPPAADADRTTLIRRATFDLIGLPPTPEEIDSFLADDQPKAFDRVVDRLLDSPQYGERWGRYWLDVVRYSDTAGDNSDFPIPQMYRYCNWVIDAFNRDLPYDQFVRQQLAGDLLPANSIEQRHQQLIATGYIANARRFGSRVDDYPRHLTIEDTLDNLGRAFLGLTINCARCHDHKFDPLTTQDYYALYGVFHSTRYPWPGIELEQKQRDLVPLIPQSEADAILADRKSKQSELDAAVRRLEKERDQTDGDLRKELDKRVADARKAAELHSKAPLPFELAYAVAEGKTIEDVRVQQKGDPNKPGPSVHRRFLTVLGGRELPATDTTSGRLQLADWIVDPHNPLTPRVIVNRVWNYHFGRGLVPTPNDFGRQGKPPTHPELLDWLAREFIDSGWSLKSLHRRILLSRMWRISGEPSAVGLDLDPTNELYSRFPQRRLDAEAIRDTLLVLGQNLDPTPGGPHPFPPQTEWKFTQHNPFKAVYETNRRSVYLMTQRIQRHPYLAIFDGADPAASTPQRLTSTTPLQALFLLNDSLVHEQSRRFAERLLRERTELAERVDRAFRLALGRPAEADERAAALDLISSVAVELAAGGVSESDRESQAWQAFVRALLRTNEFVYVD